MARPVCAAAVLAAAVVGFGLVRRRERRLRCVAVSERLMAGCVVRDNAVLRREVEGFRRCVEVGLAAEAVVVAAGRVVDGALARSQSEVDPWSEGGPL